MIRGSCLCGAVKFEVIRFVGPFELCHCSRCRKATGSAFAPMIGVEASDFTWVSGREEVVSFEAPVIEQPPGFQTSFCRHCGCAMPSHDAAEGWFEIAAGVLDDDPGILPDRHIFVDCGPSWYDVTDDLPQLTRKELIRMRIAEMKHARENSSGASAHREEGKK